VSPAPKPSGPPSPRLIKMVLTDAINHEYQTGREQTPQRARAERDFKLMILDTYMDAVKRKLLHEDLMRKLCEKLIEVYD
jgi:hypothetical protein